MHRLSIPGNACVHCGAIIEQSLICPGCGWADPLTRRPDNKTTEAEQLVARAKDFATEAHKDQKRDGGEPFIMHPAQTATIISQVTNDPELVAAAWLHDTIEDCGVTFEELEEKFGTRVATLVNEVTHERNKDGSAYFPRLKTQGGIMLKFADRLTNLADMKAWPEKRRKAYLDKAKFWASEPK